MPDTHDDNIIDVTEESAAAETDADDDDTDDTPDVSTKFRLLTCADDGTFTIVPPGCDANEVDDWAEEDSIAIAEGKDGKLYMAVNAPDVVDGMEIGSVYPLGSPIQAEVEEWDTAADTEEDEEEEEDIDVDDEDEDNEEEEE
jgi:hypothetical protein